VSSVVEAVTADEYLSAEQKQSLLSVYRSFLIAHGPTEPTEGNQ
jgi:hypothetical protein